MLSRKWEFNLTIVCRKVVLSYYDNNTGLWCYENLTRVSLYVQSCRCPHGYSSKFRKGKQVLFFSCINLFEMAKGLWWILVDSCCLNRYCFTAYSVYLWTQNYSLIPEVDVKTWQSSLFNTPAFQFH